MKKIEVGNDGIEREIEMTPLENALYFVEYLGGIAQYHIVKAFLNWFAGKYTKRYIEVDISKNREATINIRKKGEDPISIS